MLCPTDSIQLARSARTEAESFLFDHLTVPQNCLCMDGAIVRPS
jgi:hypothetical protein